MQKKECFRAFLFLYYLGCLITIFLVLQMQFKICFDIHLNLFLKNDPLRKKAVDYNLI
jgi:hypothetical protein